MPYVDGVVDRGDLLGPSVAMSSAPGFHRLPEVAAWVRQVRDAVAAALAEGQMPLLLGGDHSLAMGSLSAVAAHCQRHGRKLRVLWLDAHADFNTPATTPSGNLHGMPVACLCGHGAKALDALLEQPLLPAQFALLGVRSVDCGERQALRTLGVPVFDMRHIDEVGMRLTLQEALVGVDSDTHLHVSLDLDFLDPDIAPGVGTPVRGGPTYREAQLCMEMIADCGALASLDLVELNPARDHCNQTAELAVDLLQSIFGKSIL